MQRDFGKRSLAICLGVFLVLVGLAYGWFASFGTGNLFQPTLGTPFDALGLSLLRGEAGIPDGAVIYEAIRSAGKNVIYFGPFPALLRLPWLLLVPETFGKLAPLLGWLGGLFAAMALFVLFWEACRRAGNVFSPGTALVLALIFALGSPILYLVAVPTIYQESILWALSFSLWTIAIGYRALRRGWSTAALVLMAVFTAGALLSRLTFSLPLFGLLLGAAFLACWRRRGDDTPRVPWRGLALAALPLVLAGSMSLWYNHARFGSPLTFLTWQGYELESAQVARTRAELGTFNARRIPFSLGEYLGVHDQYVTASFPYLSPWTPARPGRVNLYFSDSAEAMITIPMASPVLVVFSALGLAALWRRRPPALTFAALLFLGQVGVICAWYFITYRYTAEFLPLIVVLTLAALEDPWFRARRLVQGVVLAIGVVSVATAGICTARLVMYQTGIPEGYRQQLIQTLGKGR